MNIFHVETLLLRSCIFICLVPTVHCCTFCELTLHSRLGHLSGLVVHGAQTAPFAMPLKTSTIFSWCANERKGLATALRVAGRPHLSTEDLFFSPGSSRSEATTFRVVIELLESTSVYSDLQLVYSLHIVSAVRQRIDLPGCVRMYRYCVRLHMFRYA